MFSARRLLAIAPILACLSLPSLAQPSSPAYSFPQLGGPETSVAGQTDRYSDEELDTLLKPLALFPDPLLAQILPAATFPDQVRAAGLWVQANPGGDVDSQPWDDSVKAVAHYPTVLEQLNKDLDWTEAVGAAFSTQSAQVTGSVQRLRRMAYDSGNLGSNAQQIVSDDDNYLTIMPPTNQVVYVPTYNPQIVYGLRPVGYYAPMISFSVGYACGSWLSFGYDWLGGGCYRYPRGSYWGCNYGPMYRNVGYIHNTYNSCAWSAPRYSVRNVTINNNYRPGGGWHQRSGGYQVGYNRNSNGQNSNGWGQRQSGNYQRNPGAYRPGGDWSRRPGGSSDSRNWSQSSSGGGYRPGGSWNRHTPGNGMPNVNPEGGWSRRPDGSDNSGRNSGGWSRGSDRTGSNSGGWTRKPEGSEGNSPNLNPGGAWNRGNSALNSNPGGGWNRRPESSEGSTPNTNSGGGWNRRGSGMPSWTRSVEQPQIPSSNTGGGWNRNPGGFSLPSPNTGSRGGWRQSSEGSQRSGGWNRGGGAVSMPSMPSPSPRSGGWNQSPSQPSRNSGGFSMPSPNRGGGRQEGQNMPSRGGGGRDMSEGRRGRR